MKFGKLFVLASAVSLAGAAQATMIDFEGLAANAHVSTQYQAQGVTFSGDATILKAPSYNYTSYPQKSGVNVIYSVSLGTIGAAFASAVNNVSFYATNGDAAHALTLTAYDSGSNVVGSTTLGYNVNSNSLVSLTANNIASVRITGTADYFTIDDFSFSGGTSGAVPEPASWAMMLGGFGMVGGAMRSRRARATVAFG